MGNAFVVLLSALGIIGILVVVLIGGGNLIDGKAFFHPDGFNLKVEGNSCQCKKGVVDEHISTASN